MSQVYPWDRGTNFAVEIGRKAASLMLAPGSNGHDSMRIENAGEKIINR
jgi:hypothetical protein